MDQHEAEKTPIDDVTEEKREYRRVRMLSHQKSVSTDSESEAEDANELPNRKVGQIICCWLSFLHLSHTVKLKPFSSQQTEAAREVWLSETYNFQTKLLFKHFQRCYSFTYANIYDAVFWYRFIFVFPCNLIVGDNSWRFWDRKNFASNSFWPG